MFSNEISNSNPDRHSYSTRACEKHPWSLADLTLADVRKTDWQLAILPMGATEPHNLHLPYATDTLQVDAIADRIAEKAWQQGAKVLVMPAVPYGTETNLREFPFALNLSPSTLFAMLTDMLASLEQSGIRKLLLLNGHGGNEFKPWLREIYGRTQVQVFLCNWFAVLKDVSTGLFEHPDDHAGEMETSLVMALRPDLVALKQDGTLAADDGSTQQSRFEAVQKGWVNLTRPWHLLTTNSGSGYPHCASAEKGQKTIDMLCERLVPFLVQLAGSPLDSNFPFTPK
jgi:creatinine amidohydrolase